MSGITIAELEINQASDMSITGIYNFLRDDGGQLIVPVGNAFPTPPTNPGEFFWRTDENMVYRRSDDNTTWVPLGGLTPGAFKFPANCLSSDSVGDFVYVSGPLIGGLRQVAGVNITAPATMPAIGVIISKSDTQTCVVQVQGEYTLAGLTPGKRYWLDTLRHPSIAPPTPAVGAQAVAQCVGIALDETTLLLTPGGITFTLQG